MWGRLWLKVVCDCVRARIKKVIIKALIHMGVTTMVNDENIDELIIFNDKGDIHILSFFPQSCIIHGQRKQECKRGRTCPPSPFPQIFKIPT